MAIAGGFAGSGVSIVPAGYMQIVMQWTTETRLDVEGASFTITGKTDPSFSQTVEANDAGYAEAIVPVGHYEVSVTHAGVYENDLPMDVIGESTQTYYLAFYGYTMSAKVTVLAKFPDNTTYQVVRGSDGEIMQQGTWDYGLVMVLSPDDYILRITALGETLSYPFTAIDAPYVLDLSDALCRVFINNLPGSTKVKLGDVTVFTAEGNFNYVDLFRDTAQKTFIYDYDGKYPDNTPIFTIGSTSFTPNTAEVTLNPSLTSTICLITEDMTAEIKTTGTYEIFAIGGGGGGGYHVANNSACGGGSGHMHLGNHTLNAGEQYEITIGQGGSGNGTPTSFGSLITVSGGEGATIGRGGSGGAGGGGGGQGRGGDGSFGGGGGGSRITSAMDDIQGGNGGIYGGGGGGGGGNTWTSSVYPPGVGGTGGTYGGDGGSGGAKNTYGSSGKAGTNTTGMSLMFTGGGTAGSGGSYGSSGQGGGGGGGGGYGGNGGNGSYYGGGGGGGYGGNGGNGNDSTAGGGGGYGGNGGNGGTYSAGGGGGGGGYGKTDNGDGRGEGYGAGGGGGLSYNRNGVAGCIVMRYVIQ